MFAAGALVFTALNFNLSREGQVTDRYTKAIEQLGGRELDVRIGGIYALERIARDSVKDHPTVMAVLTAFIREHSREQWPPPDTGDEGQERSTRPDVQAAVTVVDRRDAKRDIQPIDLNGAVLVGAALFGANLTGTNVALALFAGATDAGANLTGADLTGATFTEATLTDAKLARADLTGADLVNADLTGATLTGATLTGATLTRTNLIGANLAGADLTGATLTRLKLTGADLTGAKWPEGVGVPRGWIVDSESSRLKLADELSEVMSRYL